VRQIRAGAAWLLGNASNYGMDAKRLHIGGHSAGGHLVGMLLAGGWKSRFGIPEQPFGAALAISGLFDLEPLIKTSMNKAVGLTTASAVRNSPLFHVPKRSDAYFDAWSAAGNSGRKIDMPGLNHFDIILRLEAPGNPLFDGLLETVKRFS
jgi:arylformamidase